MESIYKKIKSIDELKKVINKLKKAKKKVVHCHGVFDLIHPGHIRHLTTAKKEGDILVVTITADRYVRRGPGRPVFNEDLRAETLAALGHVDYVSIVHDATAIEAIKSIKPDVYVKGQEYENKDKDVTGKIYDEEEAVKSVGGRLAFTYDITFSSSKLLNAHLDVFPSETRTYLREMAAKYTIDYIGEAIHSLRNLKILVIGDAIIDQYSYCQGLDRSRKSNVIVYKHLTDELFAGGSLAIANHLAGLSDNVSLLTISGNSSEYNDFIAQSVNSKIKMLNFIREDAPTLLKRRFIDNNQKLFEVCNLIDSPLPQKLEKKIIRKLREIIRDFDLVIVSDFGHGFLGDSLIKIICKYAKYLAVNTQTNGANMGFNLITQYRDIDFVALDELEIRYAAHDKNGDLNKIIKKITKVVGCQDLIVTRGNNGSLSYNKKHGFAASPALATQVVDAVGAGDAFFAFTAPCLAAGIPRDLVSFIGNAVGALAVQIVCNRQPVDVVDVMKYITRLLK